MVTSLARKPRINNVFIYFLHTGKSSHHQFPEKAIIIKLCSLWKTKNTPLPCFSKIHGCVPSQTHHVAFRLLCLLAHGVTSAKNVVSFCLGSFRLLQQNITDQVVLNTNVLFMALEPGSLRWGYQQGRMFLFRDTDFSSVLTWWISVGSLL